MRTNKEILVTTTESLEGYEILDYIKPVTAHVVAGTNLFSDFFASFTDVFGGRSTTYQKQLISIKNEAIEKLKQQAQQLGGNCILGLKIDMDEISGKSKSMFMITAIGTVAIINLESRKKLIEGSPQNNNIISNDSLLILKRKTNLIEKSKTEGFQFDDETWDFIITNKIEELYDYILFILVKKQNETSDSLDYHFKKTKVFLSSLPIETIIPKIYNSILVESDSKLIDKLCDSIKELELLDFDSVLKLINSDDFQKQKLGLKILQFDKPNYTSEDIESYQELISLISEKFPERGTRSTKKQLLSSKEKDIWICDCKKTNDSNVYCENCFKDIYGFQSQEPSPSKISILLNQKIELLKSLISN